MTRFIDDVSTLAIEDCLISKLPTIFRSNDVFKMSKEDIARLAGETESSSTERRRLEEKQRTLRLGLQNLKGLHKRRSPVNDIRHDQVPVETSKKTSVTTEFSRSEKAPVVIDDTKVPSHVVIPNRLFDSPERVEVPPSLDEWMSRSEVGNNSGDLWNSSVSSKGRKAKHSGQFRDDDF